MTKKEIENLFYKMTGCRDVIFIESVNYCMEIEQFVPHGGVACLRINTNILKKKNSYIKAILYHEVGHFYSLNIFGYYFGTLCKDSEFLAYFLHNLIHLYSVGNYIIV